LTKKIALALWTSDLFDVLLPLLCGTKSDFPGVTPDLGNKTAKLAESSEMIVQRNSLRGHEPGAFHVPNFLEEQEAFNHLRQFKRATQMRGLLPI
jgi:hypothetical protein